jgi:hypothetical protein
MTPDMVAFIVVTTIAFTVTLYFAWSNYQNQQQWQRKRDQEDLWRDLQHELDRTEVANSRRHIDLQRQLAEHRRILQYLARRLS